LLFDIFKIDNLSKQFHAILSKLTFLKHNLFPPIIDPFYVLYCGF